ncbi:MAG: homoserine dehydrogenase [Dermabacter sp.]|nr:homoserine dehydrogenase [Dermabacter sp.]
MSEHTPDAGSTAPLEQHRPLKVAILGAGTVGQEVLRLLGTHSGDFAHRVGAPLEVIGIAVRDRNKDRGPYVDASLYRVDHEALVDEADIVVEVMGGIEPARGLLLRALSSGASVVTANKALLATEGRELYAAADQHGVDISFEAAVAGAVPLIRPLRDSLAGDSIQRVLGIVNGTTNFILDAMTRTGQSFDEALAEAQELGYAEADPTADVQGHDAAAKASILASLAFHSRVTLEDVFVEGITAITAADVQAAERLGCVIKLLSIVERVPAAGGGEGVSARVYPVMLPTSHPLASVSGAYNAVFVEAEAAGRLMFYGQGAGGAPTASAVLGDLVSVARNKVFGGKGADESYYASLPIVPIGGVTNAFYLAMRAEDRPGVLAQIAGTLSTHGISIATIHQEPVDGDGDAAAARIAIVTHRADEAHMARAIHQLTLHESVQRIESLVRVEGE